MVLVGDKSYVIGVGHDQIDWVVGCVSRDNIESICKTISVLDPDGRVRM